MHGYKSNEKEMLFSTIYLTIVGEEDNRPQSSYAKNILESNIFRFRRETIYIII